MEHKRVNVKIPMELWWRLTEHAIETGQTKEAVVCASLDKVLPQRKAPQKPTGQESGR